MLNQTDSESTSVTSFETSASEEKTLSWLPWAICPAIILLLGGGIWWWLKMNEPPNSPIVLPGECCIENIRNVPPGNFSYGVVEPGKLKSIFTIDETYKNAYNINYEINNFGKILSQKQNINFKQKFFNDLQELINNIHPRKINFALVNLVPDKYQTTFIRDDREQVINNIIAYDGLLVYVPFVDCKNCQQLGKYLKEKITLKQLRDIYTGKVSYWDEINPEITNRIPIQAFVPQDEYARKLFEQLVFEEQEDIADFKKAIDSGKIEQLESYEMLRKIRELWQQGNIVAGTKRGGIGFDFQEIIYRQCNVYPLAVVRNASDSFPMLIKQDKTGVNLFENLSCNDKQRYQLNETVFRNGQYPLAFSLNLLYLNTNESQNLELGEKITEIFKTEEFQCHLSHKKLIPLELSEKDCKR
jgi:hypothetical protein